MPYRGYSWNVSFNEDVAFRRYKESLMDIDSEEQDSLKDDGKNPSSPVVQL